MRAVVQRVTSSKVSVGGKTVGEIGKGFNVLLGVAEEIPMNRLRCSPAK